jgi:hypothetical protein
MRRLSIVALLFLLTACGGTDPDSEAVGDWDLTSVNGDALPASLELAVIHSGTLSLRSDLTFVRTQVLSLHGAGKPTFTTELTGTYTVDGNTVTLTATPSLVDEGTINGRSLTVESAGRTYRHERR